MVTSDERLVNIEITEGLIINKEDDHNRWLLEGFIHNKHYENLLSGIKDQDRVKVQAVITKRENSPAVFDTEVLTIKKVEDYYSVLFEGHIVSNQIEYAELLLKKLLNEGLEGNSLVTEFKEKLRTRPLIPTSKK